jgi:hypothetical protein
MAELVTLETEAFFQFEHSRRKDFANPGGVGLTLIARDTDIGDENVLMETQAAFLSSAQFNSCFANNSPLMGNSSKVRCFKGIS